MADVNHTPVSIPSGGSFDRSELAKGLERAAKGADTNRDEAIDKALKDARKDEAVDVNPSLVPGYKIVEGRKVLAEGTTIGKGKDEKVVGRREVTEKQQVFDPKTDVEAVDLAATTTIAEGGTETVKISDVKE